MDEYTTQDFNLKHKQLYDMSYTLYEDMLKAGVAKECAREVLPLSSPTKLYMNGTNPVLDSLSWLRSWTVHNSNIN